MLLWSLLPFLSALELTVFFSHFPLPPANTAALCSHWDTLGGHGHLQHGLGSSGVILSIFCSSEKDGDSRLSQPRSIEESSLTFMMSGVEQGQGTEHMQMCRAPNKKCSC